MKKFALILSLFLTVSIFAGCADKADENSNSSEASSTTTVRRPRKSAEEIRKSMNNSSDKSENNKAEGDDKTESGDVIIWTYSENQKEDYPTTLGAYEFARLIKENSDNRINVEVHPNGEYGDEGDVVPMVRNGDVTLMRVSLAPLANFSPELNILQLPYLYRDSSHMWKVLNGDVGEQFLKNLVDTANVMGLAWYDSGARNFYTSVKEIKTPEDLAGLKIRVQDNEMAIDMVNMLGAQAVAMGYSDVLPALENKTIDGAENNWPSYESTGHYKVAKYYTIDEHTRIPEMMIMNADVYNSLSADDKVMVKEAALLSSELEREEWAKTEKAAEETVKAEGCTITPVTDVAAFQKAMQPLYEKYAANDMDLVEEIQNVQ